MPNSFDTSFIPQQPLLRVEGVKGRHEPINFALVLALILFFVVLIIAGGIYFYSQQIEKRILASSERLESLENTLDTDQIAEYKRIDSRITTAKAVLRDHTVFSVILDLLEQGVADDVMLADLQYKVLEKKHITTILGIAPSYQSAYFQIQTWRNAFSPLVLDISTEEISLDETTGLVGFEVDILFNPESLKYANVYTASTTGASANLPTP